MVEEKIKRSIVANFIKHNNFNMIADIGCNDGVYANIALDNGCKSIIGFDFDYNAINRAYLNSSSKKKNFLPLILDASNPSPNIGWNEKERVSFGKRAKFEAILALAFEHHLSIAKNIPLYEVISWIVSLAPKGLIEFVPKNDETIKKMLKFKGDIFPDYNEVSFKKYLSQKAKIITVSKISNSGRTIYEYSK